MKNIYLLLLLVINPCAINANILNKINNIITGSEIWNLDTPGINATVPDPMDRLGDALSHGDYNGDGIQDLAIGIPGYDILTLSGILNNTGTVLIIYGTSNGLSSNNSQLLFQMLDTDQPTWWSLNGTEENDFFGKSLASGDFNCDGITDLAVGTPDEDRNPQIASEFIENVGAINIFYGSLDGFPHLGAGSTFLYQGTGLGTSTVDNIEEGDRFGWSMATGDFNNDGCDDLAASAPFEDLGIDNHIINAGQVEVYYGRTLGLSGNPDFRDSLNQFTDANDATVVENDDEFGYSLAAGNVFSLSHDDLIVGIPGDTVDDIPSAGAIQVFLGTDSGIQPVSSFSSQVWSQSGNIRGIVEEHDRFGHSVSVGNFNGDNRDDVAIGVPGEDLSGGGADNEGSVNVIYGGLFGLTAVGNQSFHQNSVGIDGEAEFADQLGFTLTNGDLNGDGFDDIVIGVPRENNVKGAFHILYGSSEDITTNGSIFEKNLGDGQALDRMSDAMTIANFGNGTQLAVGIPGDDSSGGDNSSGSVEVFEFPQPDLIFADSFEN